MALDTRPAWPAQSAALAGGELRSYDIIGDVHGHASKLELLLERMGYALIDGAWRHPTRIAVFVGDFVDRGPRQLDTIRIVRAMVEAGSALAVMGNHELNAIGWATPSAARPGQFLRRRDGEKGASNHHHHKEFLGQIGDGSSEHVAAVEWFKTLPMFLDLPEMRVAHACWHPEAIAAIKSRLGPLGILSEDLIQEALSEPEVREAGSMGLFDALELVCKGVEVELPAGCDFRDQDGFARDKVRSRWWDPSATTFRATAIIKPSLLAEIPDEPIPELAKVPQLLDKPFFFGHYWMTGQPRILSECAVCVDYSAAKAGPLVACRFDGGAPLSEAVFVSSDDMSPSIAPRRQRR